MSRSYRKTPVKGVSADSDKAFKQAAHRSERRAVKVAVEQGLDPPHAKEFGDPWSSAKDGKPYDPQMSEKGMRK